MWRGVRWTSEECASGEMDERGVCVLCLHSRGLFGRDRVAKACTRVRRPGVDSESPDRPLDHPDGLHSRCTANARTRGSWGAAKGSRSWHPTQIEGSWHKPAKMRAPAVGRCVHGRDTRTFLEHASPTAPTSAPPGCQTHRRNAIFGQGIGAVSVNFSHKWLQAPKSICMGLSSRVVYKAD